MKREKTENCLPQQITPVDPLLAGWLSPGMPVYSTGPTVPAIAQAPRDQEFPWHPRRPSRCHSHPAVLLLTALPPL